MSNYINPQSEVKLLNVSIKNDYKNQYTFASLSEQTNFFMSKSIGKNFNNCTFIRDGQISVEGHIYEVYNCNYLMFKNTGFKDKWFYAFVTSIEYISENSTLINYEIDAFQSWYFNINYKQSFIVREHVTNDSIGANTVDENLGYGDYVFYGLNYNLMNLSDFYFVVGTTQSKPSSPDDNTYIMGKNYDGIYSGIKLYATANQDALANWLYQFNKNGKIDAIQFIYCVPKICLPNFSDIYEIMGDDALISQVPDNQIGFRGKRTYSFSQNNLDGYVPKNNKLFCYPYNVIELTNNKGDTAVYKPELFNTYGTCDFEIMSNMNGNVSVACFPSNYAKLNTDTDEAYFSADEGITLNNFPQCGWSGDFYKNWLAQNSYGNNIQLGLGLGESFMSIGMGLATGNPLSTAVGFSSLANTVGNYLNQNYKAQVTPNQAKGNSSNVSVLSAQGLLGFYINHKTIKYEHAKIIDDYFSMFGYKVNKLRNTSIKKSPKLELYRN